MVINCVSAFYNDFMNYNKSIEYISQVCIKCTMEESRRRDFAD
jgi:hypothetical protein